MTDHRSQVIYDPPYGGESLRVRKVSRARDKVDRLLTQCTDCQGPSRLDLEIYESSDERPGERTALVEAAEARFGEGLRSSWLTGATGTGYRWNFCKTSDDFSGDELCRLRDEMFEFLVDNEDAPLIHATAELAKRGDNPSTPRVALTACYEFRFTRPGKGELLPNQRKSQYPDGAASGLIASFSNASRSIMFDGRFPFESADQAFEDYYDSVIGALGLKLNPKRFKLRVPNKTKDGTHVELLHWQPAPVRAKNAVAKRERERTSAAGLARISNPVLATEVQERVDTGEPFDTIDFVTLSDATSLGDVDVLPRLRSVWLWRGRLDSLEDLSRVPGLEVLQMHNTAVSDISALNRCTALECLEIHCGLVEDISCLLELPNLARLVLVGVPLDELSYSQHLPALAARMPVTVSHADTLEVTRLLCSAGLGAVFYRPPHTRITRVRIPGVELEGSDGSDLGLELTETAVREIVAAGVSSPDSFASQCVDAAKHKRNRPSRLP